MAPRRGVANKYNKYVRYGKAAVSAAKIGYKLYQAYNRPARKINGGRPVPKSQPSRRIKPTVIKAYRVPIGPVYKTRGFVGKFRNRRKTPGPSAYRSFGSFKKSEFGGVVSSNNGGTDRRVQYVGHSSFNRDEISASVARAVVRKLAMMAKLQFQSWSDTVNAGSSSLFTRLRYYPSFQSVVPTTTTSSSVGPNGTWQQLADGFENSMVGMSSNDIPAVVSIELWRDDVVGAGDNPDDRALAILNAKDLRLHLYITSAMRIQNRTLASNEVGDDMADNRNDIENNPLIGRRYMYRGNATYEMSDRTSRQPNHLAAGVSDGFIEFVPQTTGELVRWSKPPSGSYLYNCFKTSKITLKPGEIKKSFLKTQKTMKFQQFIYLFNRQLLQKDISSTVPVRCKLGMSEFLGLEKVLDSRASIEAPISLGWQIDFCVGSYVTHYSKPATNTIMNVVNAAVPQ